MSNLKLHEIRYRVGQMIGVISGCCTCLLWMLAIWSPASLLSLTPASMGVAVAMTLIAIFAVLASIRGHGGVLIVLFAISFFPVGLYLIAVPHWLRWIGLANTGFLIAGLLMFRTTPSATKV